MRQIKTIQTLNPTHNPKVKNANVAINVVNVYVVKNV